MPLLTRKAEIEQETPEQYIVSHLTVTLEKEDREPAQGMTRAEQERLEDILEERDKGPFVPVPHDLVERVMEQAMARIHGKKSMFDPLQDMHPDVGVVDLVEIAEHIALDDPIAARKVVSAIRGILFRAPNTIPCAAR